MTAAMSNRIRVQKLCLLVASESFQNRACDTSGDSSPNYISRTPVLCHLSNLTVLIVKRGNNTFIVLKMEHNGNKSSHTAKTWRCYTT